MIHPSAIVSDRAFVAGDSEVRPYSVIGTNVRIGSRKRIDKHAAFCCSVLIGNDRHGDQFAPIGDDSQDKKYAAESVREFRRIGAQGFPGVDGGATRGASRRAADAVPGLTKANYDLVASH